MGPRASRLPQASVALGWGKALIVNGVFVLLTHCGRDARGPSEELDCLDETLMVA